ncbi:MAG: DNA translocase FtsK [Pseudomonadota bacterium]
MHAFDSQEDLHGVRPSQPAGRSLVSHLREQTARLIQRFAAAALFICGAMAAVSLLTWSVSDPSFNHAVDATAKNLLGYPGAAFADLAMQLTGLAGSLFIPPVLFLSWRLFRGIRAGRPIKRGIAAVVGVLTAAAAFSLVPAPESWPLPVGLGGLLGGLIAWLPMMLLGTVIGTYAAIPLFVVFAGVAAISIAIASGFDFRLPRGRESLASFNPFSNKSRPVQRAAHDPESESGDSDSLMDVLVGGTMHRVLSAKAMLGRIFGGSAKRRGAWETAQRAPWREPRFGDAGEGWADEHLDYAHDATFEADTAENQMPDPTLEQQPQVDPQAPTDNVAPRVRAARGQLKQGVRVRAEQQPSFLRPDTHELPPLALLSDPPARPVERLNKDALEQNARLLEGVLEDFGVRGEIVNVRPGPVVTLYELEPAPGTKSSRVIGLADDIARSMSAIAARVAVVSGRNAIGIELPNASRETVFLRELLASVDFEKSKAKLPLCLGKTIGGEPVIADLSRMPHLLIAGTTGSGKSVGINTMILSLLYRLPPDKCKLIMVDPKMLELSVYNGIPHLLSPVVTDPKKAVVALKWTVREMEERYRKMSKLGVRNIDGYNSRVETAIKKGETLTRTVQSGFDAGTGEPIYETEEMPLERMPYIVVIVDEMADLMMVAGKDIEGAIQRLAQMARAAGIHIIMATQRPSVDVITGTIKANFPTRISFQVTSKIDSRTILGEMGAEQLLGQGDMLFMEGGGRITRAHGPFVTDDEVEDIVSHLKMQGEPDYKEEITAESEDDPVGGTDTGSETEGGDLYDQAVAIVIRDNKASTSYVQRRLSIGYNRAATLIERMEEEGVISKPNAKGQREVLVGGAGQDA